jgi:uncharacterized protein with GYD domain
MPLYLHQWLYKDPSIRAMVTHPQDREEIVRLAIEAFDGKLHGFYMCFGEFDGVAISEFPDNKTAMACMLSIVGQGALATMRTTPLLSMEEARESMLLANTVVSPYQPPQ